MTRTITTSDGTRINFVDGVGSVLLSMALPLPEGGESLRSVLLSEREASAVLTALGECMTEAKAAAMDRLEAETKLRQSEGA